MAEFVRHELKNGANGQDDHAEDDGVAAAEFVAKEEAEKGARSAADLIYTTSLSSVECQEGAMQVENLTDSDSRSSEVAVRRQGREAFLERPPRQQAAEDALIVSEQEHAVRDESRESASQGWGAIWNSRGTGTFRRNFRRSQSHSGRSKDSPTSATCGDTCHEQLRRQSVHGPAKRFRERFHLED